MPTKLNICFSSRFFCVVRIFQSSYVSTYISFHFDICYFFLFFFFFSALKLKRTDSIIQKYKWYIILYICDSVWQSLSRSLFIVYLFILWAYFSLNLNFEVNRFVSLSFFCHCFTIQFSLLCCHTVNAKRFFSCIFFFFFC